MQGKLSCTPQRRIHLQASALDRLTDTEFYQDSNMGSVSYICTRGKLSFPALLPERH